MRTFYSRLANVLLLSAHLVSSALGILPSLDHRWRERDTPAALGSLARSNASLSSRWPREQYSLRLNDDFQLNIYPAKPYAQDPLPRVALLKDFIRDFADNLREAYPPPELAPLKAGQFYYDTESYTKWQIEEIVLPITSSKAPTTIVLEALKQLSLEVAKHGPPAEFKSLIAGRKKPGAGRNYPFNALKFFVEPLGGENQEDIPDALFAPVRTS